MYLLHVYVINFCAQASGLTLQVLVGEWVMVDDGWMNFFEFLEIRQGGICKFITGELQVHWRCITGALQVHCSCIAGALQVHCRCIAGAM